MMDVYYRVRSRKLGGSHMYYSGEDVSDYRLTQAQQEAIVLLDAAVQPYDEGAVGLPTDTTIPDVGSRRVCKDVFSRTLCLCYFLVV